MRALPNKSKLVSSFVYRLRNVAHQMHVAFDFARHGLTVKVNSATAQVKSIIHCAIFHGFVSHNFGCLRRI